MELAGFDSKFNSYFLPRATIDPPMRLQKKVFPKLNKWLKKIEDNNDDIDKSGSFMNFVEALKWFRIVILQDSVFLKEKFPDSCLWDHTLFEDAEYIEFAESVRNACQEASDPASQSILTIAPQIASMMNTKFAQSDQKTDILREEVVKVRETLMEIQTQTNDILQGNLINEMRFDLTSQGNVSWRISVERGNENAGPSMMRLTSANSSSNATSGTSSSASDSAPRQVTYKMSRSIKTVKDLWREWKQGLGGHPAVEYLEATHGTSWRNGDDRFINRRKIILKEVERLVSSGEKADHEEAVDYLDGLITDNRGSLDWLQKRVKPSRSRNANAAAETDEGVV
jgi:hypothetical protein